MRQEKDIERVYQKGDFIFKEGDPGREMFIIKSGSVDVIKEEGNRKIFLATLEQGDFFGEMSILESLCKSATVVAKEETHLVVLNLGKFLVKIKKDPTFALSIMQKMSKRIRALNKMILSRTEMPESRRSELSNIIVESEYLKGGGS